MRVVAVVVAVVGAKYVAGTRVDASLRGSLSLSGRLNSHASFEWAGVSAYTSVGQGVLGGADQVDSTDKSNFEQSAQEVGEQIAGCVDTFYQVENNLWTGFVTAYAENNTNGWGEWGYWRKGGPKVGRGQTTWLEGNSQKNWRQMNDAVTQGSKTVTVYEPCNMGSNMAYYRTAGEMCNQNTITGSQRSTIAKGLALQGFGSSYYHGSETNLGSLMDTSPTNIIAYICLQQLYAGVVKKSNDPSLDVLLYLNEPTQEDAFTIMDTVYNQLMNGDVSGTAWNNIFNSVNQATPVFFFSFAAMIVGISTPVMSEKVTQSVALPIAKILASSETAASFIQDTYYPAAVKASALIDLTPEQKNTIFRQFWAAILEIIYAFVFNEGPIKSLVKRKILQHFTPLGNRKMAPSMKLADRIGGAGFAALDTDQALLETTNMVYPGMWTDKKETSKCMTWPHSVWHVMSAASLYHLTAVTHVAGSMFADESVTVSEDGPEFEIGADTEEDAAMVLQLLKHLGQFLAEKYSDLGPKQQAAVEMVEGIFADYLIGNATLSSIKSSVDTTTGTTIDF